MRSRWTRPASRDLTQICDYLEENGSGAIARRVAVSLQMIMHLTHNADTLFLP
jgi:plasmid stabilization system protein ParE